MTQPRTLAVAVAVVSLLALAGCTPGVPTASSATPTTTSSASPTPHATSTVAPPTGTAVAIDPSILFTISTTITLETGAAGHLTQTVYAPVSTLPNQAAVEAQLDEECDGWRATFASPAYVRSTVVSTTEDGQPLGWRVGTSMGEWSVFSGSFSSFQAYCHTVLASLPGSGEGIALVPAGSAPDDPGGWGTLLYGFGLTDEEGASLTECVITVSSGAAAASARAAAWAATAQVYPGSTCDVNR